MLLKKTTTFLTIFFICLFSNAWVISAAEQDNKTEKAFELFDAKNYAEAEPLFQQLIQEKPNLLMLYYYYGACRTENQKYSEFDLIQLLNANPNEAPAKINYYLGIQYQALNNWEQALKYFNIFKLKSTVEEQTEINLAEKIQQCFNRENPYSELVIRKEEIVPVENTTTDISSIDSVSIPDTLITADTVIKNTVQEEIQDTVPEPAPGKLEKVKTIEFQVNDQITYFSPDQFKTEEGKTNFEQGQLKQNQLNSILEKIENLRNQYQSAQSSDEKNTIGSLIIPLETETYSLKEEVTQLFFQAQNAENKYWENTTTEEMGSFLKEQKEFIEKSTEESNNQMSVTNTDSVILIDPSFLFHEETEALTEEKPTNDELVYKIQIGAYSRGLPAYVDRLFKKLSVLRKIDHYTDEKGVVVYTTGNLTNYEDAVIMQKQVKQEGAEDALVVPYFNGKRITLGEAKKIEGNL